MNIGTSLSHDVTEVKNNQLFTRKKENEKEKEQLNNLVQMAWQYLRDFGDEEDMAYKSLGS